MSDSIRHVLLTIRCVLNHPLCPAKPCEARNLIIPARPQPWFLGHFWILMDHFWIFMGHFWVRRGLKMILSHMALTCFNISSYRAVWTHVKQFPCVSKISPSTIRELFLNHRSLNLATLINLWHMATSRLFRWVAEGLSGHMFFSASGRAFRPHVSHTASKLPMKTSFRVADEPEGKISRGPWQAVPKLCAARPLRFNWQTFGKCRGIVRGQLSN